MAVPTANAASFGGGTTTVTLNPAFANLLKKNKVRITSVSTGAQVTAKRLRFTISDGDASLQQNSAGVLDHDDSAIQLKKGNKTVRLTAIKNSLGGTRGTLTAGLNANRRIALLNEATAGKTNPSADFAQLQGRGIAATLLKRAATTLNNRLGTKLFKKNAKVGTVNFTAERLLRVQGGSTVRAVLSPVIAQKLAQCGVSAAPIPPAEQTPPNPGAGEPVGTFRFPVSGGTFSNARTLEGGPILTLTGGLRFSKTGRPNNDVSDLEFFRNPDGTGNVTGFASIINNRGPLADIPSSNAAATLTAEGGQVSLSQVDVRVSGIGAQLLEQSYQCAATPAGAFTGGEPFGTADVTVNVL